MAWGCFVLCPYNALAMSRGTRVVEHAKAANAVGSIAF
jgi:hypothetical protein